MDYLIINKGNSTVSFYINERGYNGYSVREAIKLYREKHGLKGKHLTIIDDRRGEWKRIN